MKKLLFAVMLLLQGCGNQHCPQTYPVTYPTYYETTYPSNNLYTNGYWNYPLPQPNYQYYYYYNGVRCFNGVYQPTGWYFYECENGGFFNNIVDFRYGYRRR